MTIDFVKRALLTGISGFFTAVLVILFLPDGLFDTTTKYIIGGVFAAGTDLMLWHYVAKYKTPKTEEQQKGRGVMIVFLFLTMTFTSISSGVLMATEAEIMTQGFWYGVGVVLVSVAASAMLAHDLYDQYHDPETNRILAESKAVIDDNERQQKFDDKFQEKFGRIISAAAWFERQKAAWVDIHDVDMPASVQQKLLKETGFSANQLAEFHVDVAESQPNNGRNKSAEKKVVAAAQAEKAKRQTFN